MKGMAKGWKGRQRYEKVIERVEREWNGDEKGMEKG